jgi:hypothetical protein
MFTSQHLAATPHGWSAPKRRDFAPVLTELILAGQKIAEKLIGEGGAFTNELASLLRAVLQRELAPA